MENRRDFLKKALYVAPVICSIGVRPAFARGCYKDGEYQKTTRRSRTQYSGGGASYKSNSTYSLSRFTRIRRSRNR